MLQENHKYLIFNYILLILLSFLAALIYLFYRDSSILFNQLFLPDRLELAIDRQQIQEQFPLPHWVIYSLPGGIWVYVTTILALINEKIESIFKIPLASYPLIFSIVLELLQLFHLTDGTFDWVDLFLILIAGFFAKQSKTSKIPVNKNPRILNLALISAFLVLLLGDIHH